MEQGINSGLGFSETIGQELAKLNKSMHITGIIQALARDTRVTLTEQEAADTRAMLLVLADLFDASLPSIDDPIDMLSAASRDIKLSTLLRERGLARLYLLTTVQTRQYDPLTKQDVLIPVYMTIKDPETNQHFLSQEAFLGWFCRESKVSRAVVFQRMRTYDRLLSLGMQLDEAFDVILQKPFAARKTLNTLAAWNGADLVNMDPAVALRLTQIQLPAQVGEVTELVDIIENSEDEQERSDAKDDLLELVKPALRSMVVEVANHPNVRDAMDMVTHDVAGVPEIEYWFDREHGWIRVVYLEKARDQRGNPYIKKEHTFHLVPEQDLPQEVLEDLREKLGFRNRVLDA